MEDGSVAAFVAPHLIPESVPLATVDDVFNAIMIRGNACGDLMFYGRGAGTPTSSSIMGDVMDALNHRQQRRNIGWGAKANLKPSGEIPMRWYLRGNFTAEQAQTVCPQAEEIAPGAVITAMMSEVEASAAAGRLGAAAMLRVL